MLYNAHDRVIGASLRKYGEFSAESEIFRQIVRRGDVVAEVGANIDPHTIEFSRLVSPQRLIVAIDSQRIVFQTCQPGVE
jgi:hypothetical protein